MDFGSYLLHTQRLTIHEYVTLLSWQNSLGALKAAGDQQGFVHDHLDDLSDFASARSKPLGQILETSARQVLERANKSVDQLVEEWLEWHRQHMEPIGSYPLTSKFGPRLYDRQWEKKLVGAYLTTALLRRGATLIRDGDSVAIPEGSSAFYVGLAIAANRRNVRIATSNEPLLREYRDNPAFARYLAEFHVVGGTPDFDYRRGRSQYGGFLGADTQTDYVRQITKMPATTLVIIPCSGMLPSEGPFDVNAKAAALKRTLIENALRHNIREVVFIGDYTKHLQSRRDSYGVPIFTSKTWQQLLDTDYLRISLVTVPPPELRDAMEAGRHRSVSSRDIRADGSLQGVSVVDEYDRAAKSFDEMWRGHRSDSSFYEAFAGEHPPGKGLGLSVAAALGTSEAILKRDRVTHVGRSESHPLVSRPPRLDPGVRQLWSSDDLDELPARGGDAPFAEAAAGEQKLHFSQEVREVARHLNLTTDEDLLRLREDLLLQSTYPGQYIAFADNWSVCDGLRVLERKVLAHSADYAALDQQLDDLPEGTVRRDVLRTTYVEDHNEGLPDRLSIGDSVD